MAFKIQSINNMKTIATNIGSLSATASSTSKKVLTSVEQIASNVSGKGTDQTLKTLTENITNETETMIKLLDDISKFIDSQTSSYSSNNQTTVSSLDDIQNTLEGLII